MSEPEDLNEKEALTALLASDGWKVYQAAMAQQWGPSAQLQQIDLALKALPPGDQDAVNMTVQQIRSASNAIMAGLRWPAVRLEQLKAQRQASSGLGFGFRRRA